MDALNVWLHQLLPSWSLVAYHVGSHCMVFLQVLKTTDFEVLRGLTNALLAAKKPDEVNVLKVIKRAVRFQYFHMKEEPLVKTL